MNEPRMKDPKEREVKPTERSRFEAAFYQVLYRDPGTAPGPTAINRMLGKKPPHNILNGRMAALRAELLVLNGFKKSENYLGRWSK